MASTLRRFLSFFRLSRDPNIPRLDRELFNQFWYLTRLYWMRPGAWASWLALLLITLWTFGTTEFSAYMVKLGGDRLNALSGKQEAAFYLLFWQGVLVTQVMSLVRLLFDFPESLLRLHWKRWMTRHFVSRYLSNLSYYRINRDRLLDNPDERISDDIQSFVSFPMSVFRGVIQTLSSLIVFAPILWKYSPRLVLFCALWTMVDTLLSVLFNRPIVNLSYEHRRLAGNFRFSLVRMRTCAESIAFSKGEAAEEFELHSRYDRVIGNELRRFAWGNLISVLNAGIYFLDQLVPTYLMAPLYFSGGIDLSGLTQVQAAWGRTAGAFGFFAREAQTFAYNGAIGARLYTLHRDSCPVDDPPAVSHKLEACQVELRCPGGGPVLISDLNLSIDARERWLVVGPNGVGKTSLLRAFAGLWAPSRGEIRTVPSLKVAFLPQRPQFFPGTLAQQLSYPAPPVSQDPAPMEEMLERVGLEYLVERFHGLDSIQDWGNILSPGEQQRLAMARLLWQAPDFAVLDEATSALDPQGERLLYDLLDQSGCGYLSVVHRTGLFSGGGGRVIELLGQGQWRIHADLQSWLNTAGL